MVVEDGTKDEKDDKESGGGNDEATKLKWKQMLPKSGIKKKLNPENK